MRFVLAQKDGTELEAYCFIKCSKTKMNIFVGKYTKYHFHEGKLPRKNRLKDERVLS